MPDAWAFFYGYLFGMATPAVVMFSWQAAKYAVRKLRSRRND